jgi:two-component system response regulator MprA
MMSVWSDGSATTENVVDRYVAYLRRKLGDPPLIHTVRGAGFVLRR